MKPPPSAIVAAKQQAFDDLRSHLPKRPDPPAHHVRIEELHDAMALMPNLKNRVSLSNLIDLMHALNAKLDERQAPPQPDGGVRVTEEMVERACAAYWKEKNRAEQGGGNAWPCCGDGSLEYGKIVANEYRRLIRAALLAVPL